MQAETDPKPLPKLTEDEAARAPAAVAGRAWLEARLTPLTHDQREAFREAVRRCYASAAES